MKRVVKRKRINVSAFQCLFFFSTRKQESKGARRGSPRDVGVIFFAMGQNKPWPCRCSAAVAVAVTARLLPRPVREDQVLSYRSTRQAFQSRCLSNKSSLYTDCALCEDGGEKRPTNVNVDLFQMLWLKGLFCSIIQYGFNYSYATFTCHLL